MSFAHLDLAAARAAVEALAAAAAEYDTGWRTERAALEAAGAALGAGELALAFRPGYAELAAATQAGADQVGPRYQGFAQAGAVSVRDYRGADMASATGFAGDRG